MTSETVLLFDPSLYGLDRGLSPNLGNLIICQAVTRELNGLLGANSYARLSPLAPLSASEYAVANRAQVRFVGGANLLSSSMLKYHLVSRGTPARLAVSETQAGHAARGWVGSRLSDLE